MSFGTRIKGIQIAVDGNSSSAINNYVSGLYVSMAQGSSLENVGVGHAWGRGCVLNMALASVNKDMINCATTYNGPNLTLIGYGAFDFVNTGNNNLSGVLGQVDTRIPYATGNVLTLSVIGGLVSGTSRVAVVNNYNGSYSSGGPSFTYFTKLSCGTTPSAGQYAECASPTNTLTFNASDASQFIRVYYQDSSAITASAASDAAVKPVPSVQIEANSDIHINEMFCEGSYACLATYRMLGLTIDQFQANSTGANPVGSGAIFIDAASNYIAMPKQKYLFTAGHFTYGVVDVPHGVMRTLVADQNSDSYARDTYSLGYNAVPASGTPPTGFSAATPGLVYPDGTTITETSSGQIAVPTATSSTLGLVIPDNSTVTISSGVLSASAATYGRVGYLDYVNTSQGYTPTTIVAAGNVAGGQYVVNCYSILTVAATTSSTMPNCNFQYTDADTNMAKYVTVTLASTANMVGTQGAGGSNYNGSAVINAKAGTPIYLYSSSYASAGATAMQYSLHASVYYTYH